LQESQYSLHIPGVISYKIPIEVHNLRVIDVELWCNDTGACGCVLKFFEQYFLIDSGCQPHFQHFSFHLP
jgi:hypothetical protein